MDILLSSSFFPFSLRGKAKEWLLSLPKNSINSWTKCKDAFIGKYYPPAKIISMRSDIMKFKQLDSEHVAPDWERMKSFVKNFPTHGLTAWMIIHTFYAGLNFSLINLLDKAAGGTFMGLTLGAATRLLDNMMVDYSEWHVERALHGRKVNSVEETSSLSEKIDVIMAMLVNGKAPLDPNSVPLASLVAQEEQFDVNFIRNNNFNNNAYRSNFGGNNYRPYPPNNGNSYGNSYNNARSAPSELEVMLKDFISKKTTFNKTIEEKLLTIDKNISSLSEAQTSLVNKMAAKPETMENTFATAHAIQVTIDENVRLLAQLHARWEREAEIDRNNSVCTITTKPQVAPIPPPTMPTTSDAKFDFDVDGCNISEVIMFLQKLARRPDASDMHVAFTKHITDALVMIKEEKLKQKLLF